MYYKCTEYIQNQVRYIGIFPKISESFRESFSQSQLVPGQGSGLSLKVVDDIL